jgi:hypothetical protein
MRAMFSGMFILVLPSFLVCAGFARMAWQRRNLFHEE